MTHPIQCDNCGATLLEDETFCGECGAPCPSVVAPAEEAEAPPPTPVPLGSHTALPSQPSDRDTIWRLVTAVLGAAGTLTCILGVAAFLLFGLTDTEGMSQSENWLFSATCCLLPIAGAGATLAVAALTIWRTRLRNR